jgi:hypothetical protein
MGPERRACFAADDTADIIVRTKNAADNATPSGNARSSACSRGFTLPARTVIARAPTR